MQECNSLCYHYRSIQMNFLIHPMERVASKQNHSRKFNRRLLRWKVSFAWWKWFLWLNPVIPVNCILLKASAI